MATPTYTPLANITLGSNASSVTFSSISQAYRDLVLVINGKVTGAQSNTYLFCNSDTTQSNYSWVRMLGSGSGSVSSSTASNAGVADFDSAGSGAVAVVQIMDYSATDKYTTRLSRHDDQASVAIAYVSRWNNTAAVTSLTIQHNGSNLAAGMSLALYGIAA